MTTGSRTLFCAGQSSARMFNSLGAEAYRPFLASKACIRAAVFFFSCGIIPRFVLFYFFLLRAYLLRETCPRRRPVARTQPTSPFIFRSLGFIHVSMLYFNCSHGKCSSLNSFTGECFFISASLTSNISAYNRRARGKASPRSILARRSSPERLSKRRQAITYFFRTSC